MNRIPVMTLNKELGITIETLIINAKLLNDKKLPLVKVDGQQEVLVGYAEYFELCDIKHELTCYVSTFDEFNDNIGPELIQDENGQYVIHKLHVGENKIFPELNRKILTTEEAEEALKEFVVTLRDTYDIDPTNGHSWDDGADGDGNGIWLIDQDVGDYHGAPIHVIINLTLPIAGNHSFIIVGERDSWDSNEWEYAMIGILPSTTVISSSVNTYKSPIAKLTAREANLL